MQGFVEAPHSVSRGTGARLARRWCHAIATALSSCLLTTACAASLENLPVLLPPLPAAPARPDAPVSPRTLYVDPTLPTDTCTTYDVGARRCGTGIAHAVRDHAAALAAARAGDTVRLRAGTYTQPLIIRTSGAPGAPITVRAQDGETVTFTGIPDEPALLLQGVSYIVVEGLVVTDVQGWGRLEGVTHAVVRNNRFAEAQARGTRGGLKLVRSHLNRILDNRFERGNDNVVIQESDRNVVAGNTFVWGRHSLLSIRCGNLNVVRGNAFHNERQKDMEIYDCEGVSDAPVKLNATQRNLVEANWFLLSRGPSEPHNYNGIQYAGQFGVVRRNVFHDVRGGGVRFQVYPQEALYNYGHRVYHNTFVANQCYAVSGSAGGASFGDILVEHNIFYRNVDCAGHDDQTGVENARAVVLRQNALLKAGDAPGFVDAAKDDFRLRPDSPLVDTAGFLTTAVRDGSGTMLPVADVKYFYEGSGAAGEVGDLIQLEGQTARARVVQIDYAGRALLLDRPLAWRAGQGVAQTYEGRAPDPGAFETLP